MSTPSLIDRAISVLHSNDTGIFTKPGPHQYPHQWNWDSALIALGLSHFDLPRAQVEIRSLLSGQWRDGMVPSVVYHSVPSDYFPNPKFWQIENSISAPPVPTTGITQPPLLATVVRLIHSRRPMRDFVWEIFPALLNWHRWLHTARDVDGSALACIIHPWESGTDDSPRWLHLYNRLAPSLELPGMLLSLSPAGQGRYAGTLVAWGRTLCLVRQWSEPLDPQGWNEERIAPSAAFLQRESRTPQSLAIWGAPAWPDAGLPTRILDDRFALVETP